MNALQNKHQNGIDLLRAFGCVAIMFWHVLANSAFELHPILSKTIIPSFNELVYLFMMISGYGMFCGYYQRFLQGKVNIISFYERRYTKILPFFACLLLLDIIIERTGSSIVEGIMEATMLFGLLPNNQLNTIGVAWTLGVIFVFYLLFPFFVFCFATRRRAWISFGFSLFISITMENYFLSEQFSVPGVNPKHTFLYCMPFFVIGGLIYLYQENIQAIQKKGKGLLTVFCVFATILYFIIPNEICEINIQLYKVMILFACWIVQCLCVNNPLANTRFIQFLSGISMEFYLAHMIVFRVIERIVRVNPLGNGITGYLLICGLVFLVLIMAIQIFKKVTAFVRVPNIQHKKKL